MVIDKVTCYINQSSSNGFDSDVIKCIKCSLRVATVVYRPKMLENCTGICIALCKLLIIILYMRHYSFCHMRIINICYNHESKIVWNKRYAGRIIYIYGSHFVEVRNNYFHTLWSLSVLVGSNKYRKITKMEAINYSPTLYVAYNNRE